MTRYLIDTATNGKSRLMKLEEGKPQGIWPWRSARFVSRILHEGTEKECEEALHAHINNLTKPIVTNRRFFDAAGKEEYP